MDKQPQSLLGKGYRSFSPQPLSQFRPQHRQADPYDEMLYTSSARAFNTSSYRDGGGTAGDDYGGGGYGGGRGTTTTMRSLAEAMGGAEGVGHGGEGQHELDRSGGSLLHLHQQYGEPPSDLMRLGLEQQQGAAATTTANPSSLRDILDAYRAQDYSSAVRGTPGLPSIYNSNSQYGDGGGSRDAYHPYSNSRAAAASAGSYYYPPEFAQGGAASRSREDAYGGGGGGGDHPYGAGGGGYASRYYDAQGTSAAATREEGGGGGPTDLIAQMLKARREEEEKVSFFNNRQPLIPSRQVRGYLGKPLFGASAQQKQREREYGADYRSGGGGGGAQPLAQIVGIVRSGGGGGGGGPAAAPSMVQSSLLGMDMGNYYSQAEVLQPQVMRLTAQGEYRPNNDLDFRNGKRLRKFLGVSEHKELWIETKMGTSVDFANTNWMAASGDGKTYYYKFPVTFNVSFDPPPPSRCAVVSQTQLQKLLDATTPTTLIVKRIYKQLTEETLRTFFEQFGKVAFATVCRYKDLIKTGTTKSGSQRNLAYIRMDSVVAQSKILAQVYHTIDGHEIEVRIPANRIFLARLPERTNLGHLINFFCNEIWRVDTNAYCIDAYHPVPYRQFAFLTCGGPQISAKLAIKADFIYKSQSITVSSLHGEAEENADKLFNDKIQALADRNELARVRSLQNIAGEVKFLLQLLSKMKKYKSPLTLLAEINNEFLKCTEEKIRNYLYVQEHVLEICKVVALNDQEGDQRKRKRKAAADGEEEEEEVEEEATVAQQNANFDEDDFAHNVAEDKSFKIASTIQITTTQSGTE